MNINRIDKVKEYKSVITFISMFVTLTIAVSLLLSNKVMATEINTYADVTIQANVPSDFTDDISITLIQGEESNAFKYQTILTKSNNYKKSLTVLNNKSYTVKASTKNSEYSISGLEEVYNVNAGMTIQFTVKQGLSAVESVTESDTENTSSIIMTTSEMYEKFVNLTQFIENNSNYSSFLKLYDNDIMKSYFLKADDMNTDEEWLKMSSYEKFCYYMLCSRPKTLLVGNNPVSSKNEMLQNLTSDINLLNNIEGGDNVISAIKTAWEWQWNDYKTKGEFTNIYNSLDKNSVPKYASDSVSSSEVEVQNNDSTTNENSFRYRALQNVKKYAFSVIILIAIGVITFLVYRKKKNDNSLE